MPTAKHSIAAAARFDAEQRAGVAANPPGVSFTIAFVDGHRQFAQGEPIRVELAFTSSRAATYRLDCGLHDRSGRLGLDEYRVDPGEHVVDPLRDHFEVGVSIGGGIRSMPVLGEEPARMTFELNEWRRFDAPGRYRLFVRSRRIQREAAPGVRAQVVTDTATSNVLEFTVVALDPASASRTVQAALSTLVGARDEAAHAAARRLRFLGTEEAAAAMVDMFADDELSDELRFGLIGSPHRAAIVRRMEARMLDEGAAISEGFIDTLALLRSELDAGEGRQTRAEGERAAARARRVAKIGEYAGRLAGVLASKRPAARAVAIETLLQIAWRTPRGQTPPPWFAAALTELPAVLARLPAATLGNLLVYHWRQIAGLALRPVLAELLDDPRSSPNLRTIVLQRIVELDPASGRARIVAEIRSAEVLRFGALAMTALGALPDATLPELDDALAARLEAASFGPDDLRLAARLVARYATPDILPRVLAVWFRARDGVERNVGAALLAYLLRVDPAVGEREARRQLAFADRRSRELLIAAAELRCGPGLESVLLDMLEDPAPEVAAVAATALGKHGSLAVQSRLWARLTRWHARWEGHAEELRGGLIEESPHRHERDLEGALWQALALGRAWLTGALELDRLAGLLLSANPREQVGRALREWTSGPLKIRMHRSDTGDVRIAVAQYSLDSLAQLYARLAQFPRGAAFVWGPQDELRQEFADTERFVAARGMTLRR
jgi:hypothetical protein